MMMLIIILSLMLNFVDTSSSVSISIDTTNITDVTRFVCDVSAVKLLFFVFVLLLLRCVDHS